MLDHTIKEIAQKVRQEYDHSNHHHGKKSCWQILCTPCSSLIHDKHEAFAFKYDTESLSLVERELMPSIKLQLYLWSILYYTITFFIPFYFTYNDCGKTYKPTLFYIYGGYSALNSIWEIYTVLRIQRYVKKKSILKFNKWHFVELLMGQIARLDTFTCILFAILIGHCAVDFLPYFIPTSFFIFVNLTLPLIM